MSRQPTHEERTKLAFRAYTDLLDAEEWLRAASKEPLALVDLTVEGFRLLEMLHREGALPIAQIAKRRGTHPSSTREVIERLAKRGWVRQALVKLPPIEWERTHLAKSKKNDSREGLQIAVVGVTGAGKKFIEGVLKRYSKIFQSIMGGIEMREQESLSRICRKLREGDVVKFLREIRMMDEEGEAQELRERAAAELERLRARMGSREVLS